MPRKCDQKINALKQSLVIMSLPTEIKFLSKNPPAKEFLPKMFNCTKEPPPLNKNFPSSK